MPALPMAMGRKHGGRPRRGLCHCLWLCLAPDASALGDTLIKNTTRHGFTTSPHVTGCIHLLHGLPVVAVARAIDLLPRVPLTPSQRGKTSSPLHSLTATYQLTSSAQQVNHPRPRIQCGTLDILRHSISVVAFLTLIQPVRHTQTMQTPHRHCHPREEGAMGGLYAARVRYRFYSALHSSRAYAFTAETSTWAHRI